MFDEQFVEYSSILSVYDGNKPQNNYQNILKNVRDKVKYKLQLILQNRKIK